MPQQERLYYLFDKYIADTASADELNELKVLLNDQSYEVIARDRLVNLLRQTEPLPGHSESRWQAILHEIRAEADIVHAETSTFRIPAKIEPSAKPSRRIPMARRWWAVAAVFLGGVTALWLLLRPAPAKQVVADRQSLQHDRAPGGNVAKLILSDGSTITLDSAQNGILTQQGNTNITKLNDGRLVYKTLDEKPVAALLNTLSTPRGGQYRLVLPDGSEVWLNASSSITYPTAFTGGERKVSISGEAYFEIRSNASMPFRVFVHAPTGEQTVEVLGTHFDVKAYNDETSVTTTLLEGSVRLTSKGVATLLQPGQQGQLRTDGLIHLEPHADTEAAIAWKNGLFHFEQTDIRDVMRQIARWYDVEIVFEGKVPEERFDGEIPRNSNLTEVFKILQLSNVHFKVEDRKVTVTP
jgi:ferric-dicitrate binding protein FerR (iron transport regulator)